LIESYIRQKSANYSANYREGCEQARNISACFKSGGRGAGETQLTERIQNQEERDPHKLRGEGRNVKTSKKKNTFRQERG